DAGDGRRLILKPAAGGKVDGTPRRVEQVHDLDAHFEVSVAEAGAQIHYRVARCRQGGVLVGWTSGDGRDAQRAEGPIVSELWMCAEPRRQRGRGRQRHAISSTTRIEAGTDE